MVVSVNVTTAAGSNGDDGGNEPPHPRDEDDGVDVVDDTTNESLMRLILLQVLIRMQLYRMQGDDKVVVDAFRNVYAGSMVAAHHHRVAVIKGHHGVKSSMPRHAMTCRHIYTNPAGEKKKKKSGQNVPAPVVTVLISSPMSVSFSN